MLSTSSRSVIALALAVFIAIAIPRLVVAALVIAGLAALLVLALRDSPRLRAMAITPVAIALAVLSAYMALTSLWALDGPAALEKSAAFFTLMVFALAAAAFIGAMGGEVSRRAARWIIGGLMAGLCYLTLEYAFGLPVIEFLAGQSEDLAASLEKHRYWADGRFEISSLVLNKNITVLALFFVPALLLTGAFRQDRRLAVRAALCALTAACAAFTESGTAIVALIAGAGLLLAGKLSARAVRWVVLAGWVTAVVLAVPLGALPAKIGATDWEFLPKSSVRARFYIWDYTAEKALERPFTGIGVRSTRELQPDVSIERANSEAFRYRPRPGRHAHNGFLQIWFETGAIGAALLLLLGLAALKAIAGLPPRLARYGHATFASMCVVGAFGYGIWQTWLLAALACTVLLYMLGVRVARSEAEAGRTSSQHDRHAWNINMVQSRY